MDSYQVFFGGVNLATIPNVDLYNHNFNNMPERKINIFKVARADYSIVTSSEYSQKDVTVYMDVCGGDRGDTEQSLNNIKSFLQAQNQPLRVMNGNVQVEYTATMNEFNIEWLGVTALVEIVFIASTPIAKAVTAVTLLDDEAITTAGAAFDLVIDGSFTARPFFTIEYSAVTGGTAKTVTLQNNQTSQGISITGNFAAGDIIEIDSNNYVVRHNGVSVDFDGLFPIFSPGSRQLLYTDDFSTRAATISGTYNPRYA